MSFEQSSPHLRTFSTSETAVKYVISSRSGPLRLWVTIARSSLRVAVAILATSLSVWKLTLSSTVHSQRYAFTRCIQSIVGKTFIDLVTTSPTWTVLGIALIALFLCLIREDTEESLLVLQGLGIQTSSSSRFFFLGPTTTFTPTTQIQDILINEAFKGFEVKFFLAVIVVGASEVVVIFPRLLPRRADLEVVWRGTRKCLYGSHRKE